MSFCIASFRIAGLGASRRVRAAPRRVPCVGGTVRRLSKGLAGVLLALPLLALAAKPAGATLYSNVNVNVNNAQRLPQCSWDQPGHNPFMGDVVAAVDRYTDIPADVRARLKQRMAKRDYDDIASIRRDSIEGKARYEPAIRDMHFGTGRVCTNVSRQAWLPTHQERGLVYCEGADCIIVPTVCRNVSRIKRDEAAALAGRDLLAPDAAPPGEELLFEPPGAGEPQLAMAAVAETFSESAGPYDRFGGGGGDGGGAGGPASGVGGGFGPVAVEPDERVRLTAGGRLPDAGGALPRDGPGRPGAETPAVAAVPEPGTWALLLLGLGAVVLRRSRLRASREP